MSTGDSPRSESSDALSISPSGPSPSEAITNSPAERIELAPIPAATPSPVSESFLGRIRGLDRILMILLLAFAFLSASFKAANSDIFMHLASGRHLFQGGKDRFSGAIRSFAISEPSVNSSWLFDGLVYQIYSISDHGDVILVAFKAALIVFVAWLLVRTGSQENHSRWIPIVLATIGILALSQRALLQPTIVSMVLLACTICILAYAKKTPKWLWALPALQICWVNSDGWFFLGPLTVVLFTLGETIQRQLQREDESSTNNSLGQLGVITVLTLLACLVNPFGIQVFYSLPPGLLHSGGMSIFKNDPAFSNYFVSPFERRYFSPYLGLSSTGIAYFVLLAISLFSFVASIKVQSDRFPLWRGLVWIPFVALSAWNYRAIPFFAIIAAPITALNLLELLPNWKSPLAYEKTGERRWAVQGRVFSMLIGVLLLALTIPGWTQAMPHYRRQVGWGIEIDPSLRDACLTIKSWQESENWWIDQNGEKLGRTWYNTSPDAAYYMAWFCPGEQTYIDSRLSLFQSVAEEAESVRKSITGEDALTSGSNLTRIPAWQKVFAKYPVDFVFFHHHDLSRFNLGLATLGRFFNGPTEFVPCQVKGSSAIFAWHNPNGKPRVSVPPADFNAQAFGQAVEPAPDRPVLRTTTEWWQELLRGEAPTPYETLTAVQHKLRFDALVNRYEAENNQGWISAQLSSLIGFAGSPNGPLVGGTYLPMRMQITWLNLGAQTDIDNAARDLQMNYLRAQDHGPVASLYLAIRAARQGLTVNPDDVISRLYLAESYTRLTYRTRERSRIVNLFAQAQMIRQSQVASALQSILTITDRPEQLRAAHELLIGVYQEPMYFDLQVKHLAEFVKLVKKVGPSIPVTDKELDGYIKAIEAELKKKTTELRQRQENFELQSANKPVLERANIALANGLSETALNVLNRADPKDLIDRMNPHEMPGATMLVSLLLAMGRTDEARIRMYGDASPDDRTIERSFGMHRLGMPAFEWFETQLGASTGDYELADRGLASALEKTSLLYSAILSELRMVPKEKIASIASREGVAAAFAGSLLLREMQYATGTPYVPLRRVMILHDPGARQLTAQYARILWGVYEQEANLWTLRAWLALEQGKLDKAREYAEKAVALAESPTDSSVVVLFQSRPLTELILDLLENPNQRN